MDFKYIEQLIDRYFSAETSLEEERILRHFFQQEEVPGHLRCYQPLFTAQASLSSAHLDERFDERILQLTGQVHVHARRITLAQRLRPLLRIAALVIVAAGIGIALQQGSDSPLQGTAAPSVQPQTASSQDELDPNATTVLDLRADAAISPADSTAATAVTH